jgi:UDP-N-acetylmuramoylalanine--D-glutamate ligase
MKNTQNKALTSEENRMLQIRRELVRESLSDNGNVAHRLELVAEKNGISYINDSKSSDIDSTWFALESMTKPVIWIVGGVDKGNDYSLLLDLVKSRVKAIVCLGKDNNKLFSAFQFEVPMIVIDADSMQEAIQFSNVVAKTGDAVLLSPACASYDMFESFEDRGEQFRKSVLAL